MSLTGRPISPPLPLISSSQILAPSSACLPLAASGPVSDIEKPILIGSPLCADARVGSDARAVAPIRPAAKRSNFLRSILGSSRWVSLLRPFLPDRTGIAKCAFRAIGLNRDNWPPLLPHHETAHSELGRMAAPMAAPIDPPAPHDNREPRTVPCPRGYPRT